MIMCMKDKQIILIPGMPSFAWRLAGLARFLEKQLSDYEVRLVPLRFGTLSFAGMVQRVVDSFTNSERVVLFGHSHGGRVACMAAQAIKKLSPHTRIDVIIAGTPIVVRPDDVPWYEQHLYWLCPAFHEWPNIVQPDQTAADSYIGYYSDADTMVKPKFVKEGFTGQLIKLDNFTHGDLISSKKIGPILLNFFRDKKV